jgi:hypothetical protein
MMARRQKWEPDSIVPGLIENTAAERNAVRGDVRELEQKLAAKQRYLQELEDALKALRGTGRRR